MQVFVRDNDVNGALRFLKKKMQREGTFREMKRRRSTRSHRSDECAKRPRRFADTARRCANGWSARVTNRGNLRYRSGKPRVSKRARKLAVQDRKPSGVC